MRTLFHSTEARIHFWVLQEEKLAAETHEAERYFPDVMTRSAFSPFVETLPVEMVPASQIVPSRYGLDSGVHA